MFTQLRQDHANSALIAAFVSILAGFGGPLAIVMAYAQSANLNVQQSTSMLMVICLSFGLAGAALSLIHRAPITMAWSTPGAVFLTSATHGMPYEQIIFGCIVASSLIAIIALSGSFDWLMQHIPRGIASGLLAGILLKFGLSAFSLFGFNFTNPTNPDTLNAIYIAWSMFIAFVIAKRFIPNYSALFILCVGSLLCFGFLGYKLPQLHYTWQLPIWHTPQPSWQAVFSIGLPLALITLAGQFMTGIVVLRNAGFETPAKSLVATPAILTVLSACFGNFGINLSAITAAICTDAHAHPDASKRYIAGFYSGIMSMTLGLLASSLVLFFSALPKAMIAMLAGLTLLGALLNNLKFAFDSDYAHEREAALITFLTCASGFTLFNLSSAFWALIIGLAYRSLQITPSTDSHNNLRT